jgi:hypothetical protein
MDGYHSLFTGTGICYNDGGIDIEREDYHRGYTLYGFDLTPTMSAHQPNIWNMVRTGSLRLDLVFSQALDRIINVIIYCEYDSAIRVNDKREVHCDMN